jgi:hypothetical protein
MDEARGGAFMKTRTRVAAWVFAVLTSYGFVMSLLAIPGTFLHTHRVPWWLIWGMLPWMVACPLWIALLKTRAWAWRPLVAINTVVGFLGISYIARMPGYYSSHPKLPHNLYAMLALNVIWAALTVCLPLWVLLTDRPSGWANPMPRTQNPEP